MHEAPGDRRGRDDAGDTGDPAGLAGRSLGPYRIRERLGAGGMGEVYLASDTRLGRDVAIKVLPAELARDPELVARLEREARVLASLEHPNVNALYDVVEADGAVVLVLQYVRGRTLADELAAGGVGLDRGLRICRDVAAGLEEAHGRGIVHRDLKPGNVMIGEDGRAQILDFGIAKVLAPAGDPMASRRATELTATGALVGTAPYMSPEQIRGADVDARCDVWAFGCLLFEVLAGVPAFRREVVADTLAAILEQEPRWAALPGRTPDAVDRLLRRCLRKDAGQRLQSIADARVVLDEVMAPGTAPAVPPAAAGERSDRRPWLAGTAAVMGLVVAAALWWFAGTDPLGPTTLEVSGTQLVTDLPGSHREPTLSPDGTMAAFVSDASGVPQIWVKSLVAEGDAVQITEGESPSVSPTWSPDNDQIVFARPGQGIWTVGTLGTPPPRQILENGYNPQFSWDGDEIVYERGNQIWMASSDGSEARQVEGVPTRTMTRQAAYPTLSPDGRWIAFFLSEVGPNGDFLVIPSAGGIPRRLTSDRVEGGASAWSPDGELLIVSSKRSGSRTLWQVPVDGGEPVPLTTGAGEDRDPVLSRDGSQLLYTNVRNERALMVSDPATGESRELMVRRYGLRLPRVSPDGSRIVFFSEVEGGVDVFTVATDGQGLQRVTHGDGEINVLPRWSADGTAIYYYREGPAPALMRVDADGGSPREVAAGFGSQSHQAAAEDPSDGLIAYTSVVAPFDEDTTFLFDPATGEETPLPPPDGWGDGQGPFHLHETTWSPDGGWLTGFAHDGWVWRCSRDRQCAPLVQGELPRWGPAGEWLYVRRPGEQPGMRSVWRVDADGSSPRKLIEYGPSAPLDFGFDVLPDGRVVWAQDRRGDQEIWRAELR